MANKTEKEKINSVTKAKSKAANRAERQKKPQRAKAQANKGSLAPHKLMLLVTVVARNKADFYLDLLHGFEVNMQMEVSAFGTARKGFGLLESDLEKQVLFSVIREDCVPSALAALEDKFASIRGGKGVAFTVPFTSMIGVAAYQFLSNKQ